jgi:RNA-directed DNA polymerase
MEYNHSKEEKEQFLESFFGRGPHDFYNKYKRKKKNGSYREICAPDPMLKELQRELADLLTERWSHYFQDAKHITGFVPGRNIMQNAQPHLGSEWVVNIDIKDFFPSVPRSQILDVLAPIPRKPGFLNKIRGINDKTTFYNLSIPMIYSLTTLENRLPQGSPASPVISNVAANTVDNIVFDIIKEDWAYTRYADDLTISTKTSFDRSYVLEITNKIIDTIEEQTCFKIKREKLNVKHKSQRQIVTGVIVNNLEMGVSRELRNTIRAVLHKHKLQNKMLDTSMSGVLNFIKQVNEEQFNKLTKEFPCKLMNNNQHYNLLT